MIPALKFGFLISKIINFNIANYISFKPIFIYTYISNYDIVRTKIKNLSQWKLKRLQLLYVIDITYAVLSSFRTRLKETSL